MKLLSLAALLPLALAAPVVQPQGVQLIPGEYIVKLKDGASESTLQDTIRHLQNGKAKHVYRTGHFRGFAAKLSPQQVETLSKLPEVEYIEQDAVVTAQSLVTQTNAPWGLGRISHRSPGSTSYVYDDSSGKGTCAYVIDTGVNVDHEEFEGRAKWLANFVDNDDFESVFASPSISHPPSMLPDCVVVFAHLGFSWPFSPGFRTLERADSENYTAATVTAHTIAGIIGGKTYGVAKKIIIFAVKVLNASGSGTTSGVIAGLQFVATDAPKRVASGECPKGTVGNISLGGSKSAAINAAAAAVVNAGVFLSVAAGSSASDVNLTSPASEPTVCTVAATDGRDSLASFSNYGSLVDILAPGVNIVSTWIGSRTATNTLSGTSMAAPHVAGLAAYLLALLGPKTPAELCQYIQDTATKGAIANVPSNTVNAIAFNGATAKSISQ
ncbi:hypothetical protein VTH06DRAFT_7473 [Thermothelomyces fergusii]